MKCRRGWWWWAGLMVLEDSQPRQDKGSSRTPPHLHYLLHCRFAALPRCRQDADCACMHREEMLTMAELLQTCGCLVASQRQQGRAAASPPEPPPVILAPNTAGASPRAAAAPRSCCTRSTSRSVPSAAEARGQMHAANEWTGHMLLGVAAAGGGTAGHAAVQAAQAGGRSSRRTRAQAAAAVADVRLPHELAEHLQLLAAVGGRGQHLKQKNPRSEPSSMHMLASLPACGLSQRISQALIEQPPHLSRTRTHTHKHTHTCLNACTRKFSCTGWPAGVRTA